MMAKGYGRSGQGPGSDPPPFHPRLYGERRSPLLARRADEGTAGAILGRPFRGSASGACVLGVPERGR